MNLAQRLALKAQEKQPKSADIMKILEENANNGQRTWSVPELPQNVIFDLVKEGFEIKGHTDTIGVPFTIIKF